MLTLRVRSIPSAPPEAARPACTVRIEQRRASSKLRQPCTHASVGRRRGSVVRVAEATQAETAGNAGVAPTRPLPTTSLPYGKAAANPSQQSTSSGFNWLAQWWPVYFIKDLDPDKPNRFTVLNLPLVIWRSAPPHSSLKGKRSSSGISSSSNGSGNAGVAADGGISEGWSVFLDVCPHRLVPLSEGRVTPQGELECPYHGWTFESGGGCTSQPEGGDPHDSRSAATALPCAVVQGMLWVVPTPKGQLACPPDPAGIPAQAEIDDDSWGPPLDVFRDLPYDYASLMENVLDCGHVPFTHHGTVSRRETCGTYDLEVTRRSEGGFSGAWPTGPRDGKWGPQTTEFVAPSFMRHTLQAQPGFKNITSVYATPIAPGRCRAFVRNQLKFGSPLPTLALRLLPDWVAHTGNNTVLEDDVIFLHEGEAAAASRGMGDLPAGKVYRMPAKSDAFVAAFRSWLDRVGGGGPFGPMNKEWLQASGPRLPREQLLDRYHSHTVNCKSCSRALARVRAARTALKAASAAAMLVCFPIAASWAVLASMAPVWGTASATLQALASTPATAVAAALLVTGLAMALLYFKLADTEQSFITGTYPPPRNTKP